MTVKNLFDKKGMELALEIVSGEEGLDRQITSAETNCMGLALTGFFAYFHYKRIQILDLDEITYIKTHRIRGDIFEKIFSFDIPAIVITRNLDTPFEFIKLSQKHNTPILRTTLETGRFVTELTKYIEESLAPSAIKHGVLMNVLGMGVLILGKSSIGKSECALELIKRGHLLVADDIVEIKKRSPDGLEGSGGELIRHHMEIRGIGIIDIKNLFGISAVMDSSKIELVVQLEDWQGEKEYERLGIEDKYIEILGVKIPEVTIPVKPGRNLAAIIEVASMNQRLKLTGYHTARELDKRLIEMMKEKENKDII